MNFIPKNFLHSQMTSFLSHKFSTTCRHFAQANHWKYSVRSPSALKMQTANSKLTCLNEQNFDYFLVLDFEATCEEGSKIVPHQEIIEFPVVQLCGKNFEEVGRFHRYVKPTERPILTSFCTELTGIVQETVTNQETLPEVLDAFDEWLLDLNLINSNKLMKSRFTFVTCGDWDLGVLLPNEASYRNLRLPEYFKRWINLKKAFCKWKGYFAKSLMAMLCDMELSHMGRLHSGIDDVKNMCQITRCMARNGYVFQNTAMYVDEKRTFENL